MLRRDFVQQVMLGSVLGGPWVLSGCGTLMYRERVHQPHSREIDWSVAAMNGLGLLFFFVPGVVAFAVDFYTGAIYLPPDQVDSNPVPSSAPSPTPAISSTTVHGQPMVATTNSSTPELRQLNVDRQELSLERIESIVSDHTSTPIDLRSADVRASQLEHLDRFADHQMRHEQDATFGTKARDLLSRVLPG